MEIRNNQPRIGQLTLVMSVLMIPTFPPIGPMASLSPPVSEIAFVAPVEFPVLNPFKESQTPNFEVS